MSDDCIHTYDCPTCLQDRELIEQLKSQNKALAEQVEFLRKVLDQIVKCNVHVDLRCGRCQELAKQALSESERVK